MSDFDRLTEHRHTLILPIIAYCHINLRLSRQERHFLKKNCYYREDGTHAKYFGAARR